jgi:hypothetical protein
MFDDATEFNGDISGWDVSKWGHIGSGFRLNEHHDAFPD